MVNLLSKLTYVKSATSNCSERSKRNDSVFDDTYIEVHCDNCGAEYIVFDTDPNLPELHRVCDTCFMQMCVRNDYYCWRLEWIKSSRQF